MSCVLLWNRDPAFIDVDINFFSLVEKTDILTDLVDLVSGCLLILNSDLTHQLLLSQHHGLKIVSIWKTFLQMPVTVKESIRSSLPDNKYLEVADTTGGVRYKSTGISVN